MLKMLIFHVFYNCIFLVQTTIKSLPTINELNHDSQNRHPWLGFNGLVQLILTDVNKQHKQFDTVGSQNQVGVNREKEKKTGGSRELKNVKAQTLNKTDNDNLRYFC